jgi:hypothetical protein
MLVSISPLFIAPNLISRHLHNKPLGRWQKRSSAEAEIMIHCRVQNGPKNDSYDKQSNPIKTFKMQRVFV